MRAARAELTARASRLILRAQPAPRQVCLAEGSAILDHNDGVAKISDIMRNYFAPGAVGAIRRQVTRFTRYRRTDQSIDEFVVALDLPRRMAESGMEMGTGSPEQILPISCLDNAASSPR